MAPRNEHVSVSSFFAQNYVCGVQRGGVCSRNSVVFIAVYHPTAQMDILLISCLADGHLSGFQCGLLGTELL